MSRRQLWGLFAVALAVRVAALVLLDAPGRALETAHHEHATIARSLALGQGFRFNFFGWADQPLLTSQQAPLVPSLLAGCYLAAGVETRASFWLLLAMQAAVSSATAVGAARIARQASGSGSAAMLTGVGAAFYPPFVASSLHIQALAWNLAWLTLMVDGAVTWRKGDVRAGGTALVLGGTLGVLTDPILGGVLGMLLTGLAWDRYRAAKPLIPVVCVAAAVLVGVAPWMVRNAVVHGRLVPVKDSFFYVFWQGNNHASQGTDKLLVAPEDVQTLAGLGNPRRAFDAAAVIRRKSVSVDSVLPEAVLAQLVAMPREIDRMDFFRRMAMVELASDPRHYFQMCLRRLRFWLLFDETNPRSFLPGYRTAYLTLAGLAVLGLGRSRPQGGDWSPILLAMAALTAVHVLIITSARFRIPLELLMTPPAGVAAALLWEKAAAASTKVLQFAHFSRGAGNSTSSL